MRIELVTVGPEPTTIARAYLDGTGLARFEFATEGTAAPALGASMIPPELGDRVAAVHVGTLGLVLEPIATSLTALVERERDRPWKLASSLE